MDDAVLDTPFWILQSSWRMTMVGVIIRLDRIIHFGGFRYAFYGSSNQAEG